MSRIFHRILHNFSTFYFFEFALDIRSICANYKVNKDKNTLTGEVVVHGRQRPRRPRLPQPRDAPRPWPDAAGAAVRDADETVAEAPDEGANIRSRGRPSADDAVAAVAAATGMRPDKRPPSPASCRRLLLIPLKASCRVRKLPASSSRIKADRSVWHPAYGTDGTHDGR